MVWQYTEIQLQAIPYMWRNVVGNITHWCLAANSRIGIYNGEMVFNRLLDIGWSDLDDFLADPHEISILVKW